MRTALLLLLCALTLAGCDERRVVVGSKVSDENRVVAELLALRLEAAGLPVTRRPSLGDSGETLAALRAGAIDLYPEYTGTGLAMLGLPATQDRAEALAEVRAGFAPLGLRFLAPLGYESRYVVVLRRETARALDAETVSDLVRAARRLRLGVTRAFADRSEDGLAPLLDRYGLDFAAVEILPDAERPHLYDRLLEGALDVVVGFSTDPEIGDYLLTALPTDPPFFPAYEATPLVSEAALAARPGLEAALAPLAGRLDAATMRDLVRQTQIFGREPRAAAAEALARLGLGGSEAVATLPRLRLAMTPPDAQDSRAARLLRALREAAPGREVELVEAAAPLAAVAAREARVALAPALALLGEGPGAPPPPFEAVAVAGSAYLHALAPKDGVARLADAGRIASGPEGSPSHVIAAAMAEAAETAIEVVPLADRSATAAAAALRAGRAEAALVLAGRGRGDLEAALAAPDLALLDAAAWWRGPVRLALPALRAARIPGGVHTGRDRDVETLATQMLLVGPSAPEARMGVMGPGTFAEAARPLTDAAVRALDAALGEPPDPSVHVPVARALRPTPAASGPAGLAQPGGAALLIAVLGFAAWGAWLFLRRSGSETDPPDGGAPAA